MHENPDSWCNGLPRTVQGYFYVIEHTPTLAEAVASTPAKLDQELARQLNELTADEREGSDRARLLRPAVLEAAVWCSAALGAWLAVALVG